ncbi:MAG: IPT/TIG domain-containing protein [Chitinophagaceae bacterium]|nr:IPT/TIG domain-containing protein [Chitinophagaceae bacterium]MCW5927819.1 IPT/TIG domain-containing protein [Chitinophagaceae bacterium]
MKESAKPTALFLLLFCLLTGLNSCKKEGGSGEEDEPTKSPVKITGYAPKTPYWGDEITITGEGFSSNKSDMQVWFPGMMLVKEFAEGEILEASSTQIKVKTPYRTRVNANGEEEPHENNGSSSIVLKVKGKEEYSTAGQFVYYRAVPHIVRGFTYKYNGEFMPGGQFELRGMGFGPGKSLGILSVNGTSIPIDTTWASPVNTASTAEGNIAVVGTIPISMASRPSRRVDYTFKYSINGRSTERTHSGISLPSLTVKGNTMKQVYTNKDSYSDFEITGTNLFADEVRFSNPNRPPGQYTSVAVTGAGFGATRVSAFVPLALLVPFGRAGYNVSLYDTQTQQGWHIGTVTVTILQ